MKIANLIVPVPYVVVFDSYEEMTNHHLIMKDLTGAALKLKEIGSYESGYVGLIYIGKLPTRYEIQRLCLLMIDEDADLKEIEEFFF